MSMPNSIASCPRIPWIGAAFWSAVLGAGFALAAQSVISSDANALNGPVLGLCAGQDQGSPQDSVEKMRKALAESTSAVVAGKPAPCCI
jgi:dienelactone hydrolase